MVWPRVAKWEAEFVLTGKLFFISGLLLDKPDFFFVRLPLEASATMKKGLSKSIAATGLMFSGSELPLVVDVELGVV